MHSDWLERDGVSQIVAESPNRAVHDRAMSLILSHSTALCFHRLPRPSVVPIAYPEEPSELKSGPPTAEEADRARSLLEALGVPREQVEMLDVLVSSAGERRRFPGVHCHVCTLPLPAGALWRIDNGIFVVDPRFCALQAAQYMSKLELVELYYELCGSYALPLCEGDPYSERSPLTSTSELARFFRDMVGEHGARSARTAVRYARDGARSPMESAATMTIVLPKRDGGLGIQGVVMDREISVSRAAKHMTKRRRLYADAYIASARLLIEYMGMRHEEERRQAEDSERDHALDAMGYHVIRIWRWGMFDKESYRRILKSICVHVGLGETRFPEDFAERQEELRRFVLRRWL